jgi:hypothetical protein
MRLPRPRRPDRPCHESVRAAGRSGEMVRLDTGKNTYACSSRPMRGSCGGRAPLWSTAWALQWVTACPARGTVR